MREGGRERAHWLGCVPLPAVKSREKTEERKKQDLLERAFS